jgi:hypothetical protein
MKLGLTPEERQDFPTVSNPARTSLNLGLTPEEKHDFPTVSNPAWTPLNLFPNWYPIS